MESNKKYRQVDDFDRQPKFASVIPADLVFPWGGIAVFCSIVLHRMWGLSLLWSTCVAVWGCSTWWILVADKGWRYLAKFMPVPNWASAQPKYRRFLELEERQRGKKKGVKHG